MDTTATSSGILRTLLWLLRLWKQLVRYSRIQDMDLDFCMLFFLQTCTFVSYLTWNWCCGNNLITRMLTHHTRSKWSEINSTLRFPHLYIYVCVRTYHVRNNYDMYIVAMWPYFNWLRQFRRLLCVAAMSSLPQLWLRDGYWQAEATSTQRREADRERKHQKQAAKYSWCLQSR